MITRILITTDQYRGGHGRGGGGVAKHRNTAKNLTNTASLQENSTKHRHRNNYF